MALCVVKFAAHKVRKTVIPARGRKPTTASSGRVVVISSERP